MKIKISELLDKEYIRRRCELNKVLGVIEEDRIHDIENDTGVKEYDWVEKAEARVITSHSIMLTLRGKTIENCKIDLPFTYSIINNDLGKVDILKSRMTLITGSHVKELHLPELKYCRSTKAVRVASSNIDELYIIDRYSVDSYITTVSSNGNLIKRIYSRYPLIAVGGGILLITRSCMDIVKKHGLGGRIKEDDMISFTRNREGTVDKNDIKIELLADIVGHLSSIKEFGIYKFMHFRYCGYKAGWFMYEQ